LKSGSRERPGGVDGGGPFRPRPRIGANLSSSKVDLRPLFPKGEKKPSEGKPPTQPAAAKKDRVFPADPLPLEGLKALDGEVNLRVEKILGLPVSDRSVDTQAVLEKGNLTVKPFRMRVSGAISAEASACALRRRSPLSCAA